MSSHGTSRKSVWALLLTLALVLSLAGSGLAATCSDGILNQDEVQTDCGGATCLPCNPFALTLSPTVVAANALAFTVTTPVVNALDTIELLLLRDVDGNGQIDYQDWPVHGSEPDYVHDDNGIASLAQGVHQLFGPDSNPVGAAITTGVNLSGAIIAAGDYIVLVRRPNGTGGTQEATAALTVNAVAASACQMTGDVGVAGALVQLTMEQADDEVLLATAYADVSGAYTLHLPASVPCTVLAGGKFFGELIASAFIVNSVAPGPPVTVNATEYFDAGRELIIPGGAALGGPTTQYNIAMLAADGTQVTGALREYATGNPPELFGPEVWGEALGMDGTAYRTHAWADDQGAYSLPIRNGWAWTVQPGQYSKGYFDALFPAYGYQPFAYIDALSAATYVANASLYRSDRTIELTVQTEDGTPLAVFDTDAIAQRVPVGDAALDNLASNAITGSNGLALLRVDGGTYSVGHFPPEGEALVNGSPVELVPGPQVEVSVATAGTSAARTVTAYYADGAIEGCVFEDDGTTPAPMSRVVARSTDALNDGATFLTGGQQIVAAVETGHNGCFRLPLLSGSWMVQAFRPAGFQGSLMQSVVLVTDGDEVVEPAENEVQDGFAFYLYPTDAPPGDLDGDGLPDAYDDDIDGDGLPNSWETQYGLNPNDATGINGATGDPDGDGLTNEQERVTLTNPKVADTDGDGLNDSADVHPTVYDYIIQAHAPLYASITSSTNNMTSSGSWTSERVASGSDVTYTIAVTQGYVLTDVTLDGVSQGAVTSLALNDLNAKHTIRAFASQIVTYTLQAYAPSSATITSSTNNLTSSGAWASETVTSGADVTFTITVAQGYQLTDVTVDGSSVGITTSVVLNNITAAHTIRAYTAAVPTYTLQANAPSSATITSSTNNLTSSGSWQSETVTGGIDVTYTIAAKPGYQITDVTLDGASQGRVSSVVMNALAANHVVRAFTAPLITLQAYAPASATITSSTGNLTSSGAWASEGVSTGANVTYSITVAQGYQLTDVTVDGSSVGITTSVVLTNITAAHTIRAYTAVVPIYTLQAYAPSSATISSSTNNLTSSGAWVSETVTGGTNVNYTITAKPGYQITDVTLDGVSQGAVTSVVMNGLSANHTVRAYAVAIPMSTIQAHSSTKGSIVSSTGNMTSSGAWVYEVVTSGTSPTYTITANSGYVITDVTVDGVSQGAVGSVTLTNVTGNHVIRAFYAP